MALLISFCILLSLPIIGAIIYARIMMKKAYFSPVLKDLLPESEKNNNESELKNLQEAINIIINNVNGWLHLTTFYLSFHFLLNIFSIELSLFCIYSIYEDNLYTKTIVAISSVLSVIFSSVNLFLNCKEKAKQANTCWHKTSELTADFLIILSSTHNLLHMKKIIIKYQKEINRISTNSDMI